MKPFAIAALLALSLPLAACGDSSKPANTAPAAETTAPATNTTAPANTTTTAPAAPANTSAVPAGAPASAEEAIARIQNDVQKLNLTDAEKQKAIADARTEAEKMARANNMSDAQVKQAGDAAEQAAKTMFGMQ